MKAMGIACALLCLMGASVARADGLPTYYSVKDAQARPITCYAKVYGAGQFIQQDGSMGGIDLPLGSNGLGIGGGLGCDITQGQFLAGVFGDYTWNKANSNVNVGGVTAVGVPFGSEWSVGARVGVFPTASTLLYGLVAYTAAQDRTLTVMATPFSLGGPKGVTLGAGIETALSRNVVLSFEYRHTAFDTNTAALLPVTVDTTENAVRAGIAYRF